MALMVKQPSEYHHIIQPVKGKNDVHCRFEALAYPELLVEDE
jgi:hypothetical protein